MANFFEDNAYVYEQGWTATGESQKLTKEQKASIVSARIKDSKLEDGTILKNIVFMMKAGKPRSFKLSPYNEQFVAGTRIDVNSVEITEYTNDEGELKYTATADSI